MCVNSLQCQNDLRTNGYIKTRIELPEDWLKLVRSENWEQLDKEVQLFTSVESSIVESPLTSLLKSFCEFESIEFIISIRDAKNEWEEDGIWHDDGSRKLAFSLSLTENSEQVSGGVLEIRKKGNEIGIEIPPFAYGEVVVFLTGTSGFEHKINQVTKGRRIIIAGWCS